MTANEDTTRMSKRADPERLSANAGGRLNTVPGSEHELPSTAADPAPALNVLLMGMHRSGTSALAGALHRGGLYAGTEDDLEWMGPENPEGYVERKDVVALNERLLASLDWRWDTVPLSPLSSPPEREELVIEARQLVRKKLTGHGAWLIKDPRLSVLLPWWRQILLDRFVAVITIRDAPEVSWSLALRDGFSIDLGSALWTAYHRHLAAGLDGLPVITVDYSALAERPAEVLPQALDALRSAGVTAPLDLEQAISSIRSQLRRATFPTGSQREGPDAERLASLYRAFLPSGPVVSFDHFHLELDEPDRWDAATLEGHSRVRKEQDEQRRILAEVHSAPDQATTAQAAAHDAQVQLADLRERLAKADAERDAARGTIDDLRAAVASKEELVAQLRANASQIQAEAIDLRERLSALEVERNDLASIVQAFRTPAPSAAATLRARIVRTAGSRRNKILRRLRDRLPWSAPRPAFRQGVVPGQVPRRAAESAGTRLALPPPRLARRPRSQPVLRYGLVPAPLSGRGGGRARAARPLPALRGRRGTLTRSSLRWCSLPARES